MILSKMCIFGSILHFLLKLLSLKGEFLKMFGKIPP